MRTGYASDTWTGSDPRGFAHWLRTGIVPPEPDKQAEAELKFNPYHDPANGRFTFATGGVGGWIAEHLNPIGSAAAAERGSTGLTNLALHEAAGGHAISEHVNRSPAALFRTLETRIATFRTLLGTEDVFPDAYGTFTSLASANRLTAATLAANTANVAEVASGRSRGNVVLDYYDGITGREAKRSTVRSQSYLRVTRDVRVVIRHDPRLPNGYLIVTGFPGNFR